MMQAAQKLQESIELTPEVDQKIAQLFPNSWETLQQHRQRQDCEAFQMLHEMLWYELKARERHTP